MKLFCIALLTAVWAALLWEHHWLLAMMCLPPIGHLAFRVYASAEDPAAFEPVEFVDPVTRAATVKVRASMPDRLRVATAILDKLGLNRLEPLAAVEVAGENLAVVRYSVSTDTIEHLRTLMDEKQLLLVDGDGAISLSKLAG